MERYVLTKDVFNDTARYEAVSQFRRELGLSALNSPESQTSPLSMGIEIEVTWRHAFPELAQAFPFPNKLNPSSSAYKVFSDRYNEQDITLKPLLERTQSLIPRVGVDAYWEFSFLPTFNTSVTSTELQVLFDLGLLQDGNNYSMHMTVAGIETFRDAYAFLCGLEYAGGTTPERILEAVTSKKGAWSRKGKGGVMIRRPDELLGNTPIGFEFRTLTATSQDQINTTLETATELAEIYKDETLWMDYRNGVEHYLKKHDLPLSEWPKPTENTRPWLRYVEVLEAIR